MVKATPKAWNSAGKTDPINSFWMHRVWMDSKIKKQIIQLQGYSKPFIGRESADKVIALEREIIRLVKNGYVFGLHHKYKDKTVAMEIFLNGNFLEKSSEKILTLYPTHYEFEKVQEWIEDTRLNGFLQRLYNQVKQGSLDLTKLLHKGKFITSDQLFDISKKRFTNHKELYEFTEARRREGCESGEVFNFTLKYLEKWPLKS